MSRFVLSRTGADERVVAEAVVQTEAALHDVLMRHPSLIPAADLGFGRMATVGFETSLASGNADLVLLDDEGRICIVEVKKEGNPDTRRVVAQVTDYAAALWGKTIEQFEHNVLRPKLGPNDPRGLREFVIDELLQGVEDPEASAKQLLTDLSETLHSGDFALVVAAPVIPDSVHRVIEYLNVRGLSIYGLEVSYFAGEVEIFVPRIVVRPTLTGRIVGRRTAAESAPVDAADYIEAVPDVAREAGRQFLDTVPELGGEVRWRGSGPRVEIATANGPRIVVSFNASEAWLVTSPIDGLPTAIFAAAAQAVQSLPSGGSGSTYPGIRWAKTTAEDVKAFLAIACDYVGGLVSAAEADKT